MGFLPSQILASGGRNGGGKKAAGKKNDIKSIPRTAVEGVEVCECALDMVAGKGRSEEDGNAVSHLRRDMGFSRGELCVLGS